MIKKEEIYERKAQIAEIRHADGVYRDIKARLNERSEYNQRWFWELLQNAKDSVNSDESVDVKIQIDKQFLTFSHNGNAFDIEDILSLILQGSSKNDKVGKAGRFGTGFMTTYLLSRKVEITSYMSDGNGAFKFILNREGVSNSDFFRLQTESNEAFANSVRDETYIENSDYQTRFLYFLDQKGYETAEIGIESMNELIPFTQIFNDQISSVVLNFKESETHYKKDLLEAISIEGINIKVAQLSTVLDGVNTNDLRSYVLEEEDFEVCMMTRIVDGVETVINLNERFPKLYFTFPLIGTEDLGIPLVINSLKFEPKVERDGIYLSNDTQNPQVLSNKKIISDALRMSFGIFTKLVVDRNMFGIDELFNLKPSVIYPWLDSVWLNSLKIEIFDSLNELKCIPTNRLEDKLTTLNELWVPYLSNDTASAELWGIIENMKDYPIPELNYLNKWIQISKSQSDLRSVDINDYALIFGMEDLLSFIEKENSFNNLETAISGIMPNEWLNKTYKLINQYHEIFPLEREILLNQQNNFRRPEGMHWDYTKDEILNNISEKVGLNFKNILIALPIKQFDITGIKEFDQKYAVSLLANRINSFDEKDYSNLTLQEANARFLKWLIDHSLNDIIKELKIISSDKKNDEDTIIVQAFSKGKHLILTPKAFFDRDFPVFSTLVRNRDCMHNMYNQFLTDADYKYLEKEGLIHFSPLVTRKEILDTKLLELLIVDSNDMSMLVDEEGKITTNIEITYSDFAYLTATEGHIYDRNTTPTSSLERFKFLLLEACEKDPFLLNPPFEFLVNEEKGPIKFYRCLWLCRAKNLPWIKVKNIEAGNDQKFSEAPSSKNLSSLITGKDDLIKAIKGDKQQLLLNQLGVGVSDLIRSTLSTDELRLSWDKAITSMIISDADPNLIQEIFNDAGIKQEYQRRLNQRKLISRNQNIGYLIETLFKETIIELQKEGTNISINREPFGSDYIISDESSDLVNDQMVREGFKINEWLIEVKATGKDFAAMTLLQAQTASKYDTKYALVVVPLDGSDPDLGYVQNNARIIDNIGIHIGEVIEEYDDMELKKQSLFEGTDSISVNVEDHQVRFRVKSSLWESKQSKLIRDFVVNKFKPQNNEALINS